MFDLIFHFIIVSSELIESVVKRTLKEQEDSDKILTIVISKVSQTQANSLFQRTGISFESEQPEFEICQEFDAFKWNGRDEDDGVSEARTHLENQLRRFGVTFGRGHYRLFDCHQNKTLLNCEDDKIGKISGGTDFIIAPYKTATSSLNQCASVLFEIKCEKTVQELGLEYFLSQAQVELVAARVLSLQPRVLVVLTDLVTSSFLLELTYSPEYKSFVVHQYEQCHLSVMATKVSQFLIQYSVPDVAYRPMEGVERDQEVLTFKRTKMSNDVGIALEHFQEMIDDTEQGSAERYELARQLFLSSGFERVPSILNDSWRDLYT